MIARLTGRKAGIQDGAAVIDVNGVGYLVHATPSVLRQGEDVVVETHLHVREDALQLYGFGSADERDLFVRLLSVNGIGPKVALAIVSSAPAADLRRAIALEDARRFEAIPGIGKKTAQRIVLELKEKLAFDADAPKAAEPLTARDALVELGYTLGQAEDALRGVDTSLQVEEQIRQALRKVA